MDSAAIADHGNACAALTLDYFGNAFSPQSHRENLFLNLFSSLGSAVRVLMGWSCAGEDARAYIFEF
jgi:hypothetical protein